MPGDSPRVLAVALDAADAELIDRWVEDGTMPNLRSLRERGAHGRLAAGTSGVLGSPWLSFNCAAPPEVHGLYHLFQWDPDVMGLRRLDEERIPFRPFWRDLATGGRRVIVFDMPYAAPAISSRAIELTGWATHDTVFPAYARPRGLLAEMEDRFGPWPNARGGEMADKLYAPQPLERLLEHAERISEITERAGELALALLREHPWHLLLGSISAAHRAGHVFWDVTSAVDADDDKARECLRQRLRDAYVDCDRALGRLVEAAGEEVHVVVFSLHGMTHNVSRVEILDEMVRRVLTDGRPSVSASVFRRLKRLRQKVPDQWRAPAKSRLPLGLQDRMAGFWRLGRRDWSRTRAIAPTGHVHGYVRVNLRGRESRGCVEPGAPYRRLCDELALGLLTFTDADTGEAVIRRVDHRDDLFPPGPRRELLPDLIIEWSDSPAAAHRAVMSPKHGAVKWPTPGNAPNGRSGNHRSDGWLVSVGKGVEPGGRIEGADLLDLAATFYALLGIPVPDRTTGSPIEAILPKIASRNVNGE